MCLAYVLGCDLRTLSFGVGSEHGLSEHIWDRSVPKAFRFSKIFLPLSLDLDFCVHTAAAEILRYRDERTETANSPDKPAPFQNTLPWCTQGAGGAGTSPTPHPYSASL